MGRMWNIIVGQLDRRLFFREPSLGSGRVVLSELKAVDCEIQDWTAMGARVRLAERVAIPSLFELVVLPSGQVRQVRLVWQNGVEAGLRFA